MANIEDQIYNQFLLFMDKPISTKTTHRIHQLIKHSSSPKLKIFQKLLTKNRPDLLFYMILTYPYVLENQHTIQDTFLTLIHNITNFQKISTVTQIWKQMIKLIYYRGKKNQTMRESQEIIYQYGYEELLNQGIKVPNLQKKDCYFGLIQQNIKQFQKLGLKGSLRKAVLTFTQTFVKYPITVVNYIKVLSQVMIVLNASAKNEKAIQQNNKILNLEELPRIDDQQCRSMIMQLNFILKSTAAKQLHSLHNQCLNCILLVMNYCRFQQALLNTDYIYQLKKILETFLYRKGTRDQARKLAHLLNQHSKQILNNQQQKMFKRYINNQQNQSNSDITNEKQINQKSILIENVIKKTNQFLAKYEVNSLGDMLSEQEKQPQKKFMNFMKHVNKNGKFLKKGKGMGGGRALLQVNQIQLKDQKQHDRNNDRNQSKRGNIRQSKCKPRSKIEDLLQNCLLQSGHSQENTQNQHLKRDAQFVNVKQAVKNTKLTQENHSKSKRPSMNFEIEDSIYSQFYEQTLGDRKNPQMYEQYTFAQKAQSYKGIKPNEAKKSYWNKDEKRESGRVKYQSSFYGGYGKQGQVEINEINQLIQLAYSYKFGYS